MNSLFIDSLKGSTLLVVDMDEGLVMLLPVASGRARHETVARHG